MYARVRAKHPQTRPARTGIARRRAQNRCHYGPWSRTMAAPSHRLRVEP
ncbi:hypothetical protein [Lysobacter gummosus]|nr:hypothetical protein LG3211_4416 [Lysobacter gummosus]